MKAVKAMRINRLVTVLVGVIAISIFATDAAAYFHPKMGRFISRDPGAGSQNRVGASSVDAPTNNFIPRDPTGSNQYADGMSLYQYVRSTPTMLVDSQGTMGCSGPTVPAPIPRPASDLLRDWGDMESRKDYSNSQGDPATEGWLHEKIEGLKGQLGGPWRKVIMDKSERMGVMHFETYRRRQVGIGGGLTLDGGFVAWKRNLNLPPHCCQELRWAQLVMTNQPMGGTTSPYIDPRPEDDPSGDPFYLRTDRLPHETTSEVLRFSGSGSDSRGYDLRFEDSPERHGPGSKQWRAELCLVCVTDRGKKELRYLQCVEYGFEINSGFVSLMPQHIWDKGKGMPRHHAAVIARGWTIK